MKKFQGRDNPDHFYHFTYQHAVDRVFFVVIYLTILMVLSQTFENTRGVLFQPIFFIGLMLCSAGIFLVIYIAIFKLPTTYRVIKNMVIDFVTWIKGY